MSTSPGLPPLGFEALEMRCLLSTIPVGGEFRANTYTTNAQFDAAVAMDSAGDFVVAWVSGYFPNVIPSQDGSTFGVYAQRYNAAGVAQGSEFRVNTHTTDRQARPQLAMDSAGDFVIAWASDKQDGSGYGIYAQRYNNSGVAQGSEFQVNTYTTDAQQYPAVAMDAAGDFVIAWQSKGQDGIGYGVYGVHAQRYNAFGVAQGSEFPVDTTTGGFQQAHAVAMDAAGDFVVTWVSFEQGGNGFGIYAQRYNNSGVAQGNEFHVNTYMTGAQGAPIVAMDAAGDCVIAWQSDLQDGSNSGVYAQRYNAAGVAQGGEFRVNTYTTNHQRLSRVAMDSDGDFVITWESRDQDGSAYGSYAQRYNTFGMPKGSEFQVNTFTTDVQADPAVAMDAAGDFVIAWHSGNFGVGQDGSSYGVYAQRYTPGPAALWENPSNPCDANNNALVTPLDALVVVNYLNSHTDRTLPATRLASSFFLDVNGDGLASSLDVLVIINYLNSRGSPSAGPTSQNATSTAAAVSLIIPTESASTAQSSPPPGSVIDGESRTGRASSVSYQPESMRTVARATTGNDESGDLEDGLLDLLVSKRPLRGTR